jgi:hypothetical protein
VLSATAVVGTSTNAAASPTTRESSVCGENYKGPGGEAHARALPTTRPGAVPRTARPGALEAIWDLSGSAQG